MNGQTAAPGSEETEDPRNGGEQHPVLDPKIQDAIGKALRAYCADIVAAPIPDKFLALLARLEAREGEGA